MPSLLRSSIWATKATCFRALPCPKRGQQLISKLQSRSVSKVTAVAQNQAELQNISRSTGSATFQVPSSTHRARQLGLRSFAKAPSKRLECAELVRAAKLASWSGLCYVPWEDLPARAAAEGLQLVAEGRTYFTAWFVADGQVDYQPFLRNLLHNMPGMDQEAVAKALKIPQEARQRFVFTRGVAWGAPDIDGMAVWRDLAKFWPTPFAPELTTPPKSLVAHAGVAAMAQSLYPEVSRHLAAPGAPAEVCFAGHSLGGSLGQLMAVLARVEKTRQPYLIRSYSYGSPPVLSHAAGGGSDAVLGVLGMAPSQLRSFVLEDDPVPRAMLTSDPFFSALKQWSPAKRLLELRSYLLGEGAMVSSNRFLFETVGDVQHISWSGEGGTQVVPLAEAEPNAVQASTQDTTQPTQLQRSIQALLDHAHHSYVQELELAALLAGRKQLREAGLSRT